MGYYTEHSLEVRNVKSEERFNELSNALIEKELLGYALYEGTYFADKMTAYFGAYDAVKWYDHAKDMVGIAERFPEMYFELSGEGEEFGDFWKEYYHDMDVEECRGEVVYEQPKRVQWKELMPF